MKKITIMLAAAASLFMFPSCRKVTGEGPVQSEFRSVGNFSGLSSAIGCTVNYTIAPEYKIELVAQRNILDVLETSRVGGHLLVNVKPGVIVKNDEDIVINISAPTASYLHQSGSGTLRVSGDLVASNMDMGVSGSGSIFADRLTISNKMDAAVSGSGSIHVKEGTVAEENVRISGSGNVRLAGVNAAKGVVIISGSGNAQLNLSQSLNATISGSGSVFYHGSPQVSTHISGSGKVVPM